MKYKNPVYNQNGTIDCELDHPVYGWIPFTADPNDCEQHGREMFSIITKNGNIQPYTKPVIANEQLAEEARLTRDELLMRTDWTQLPDVPHELKIKWQGYRQALRDVPQQANFPINIAWPEEPS